MRERRKREEEKKPCLLFHLEFDPFDVFIVKAIFNVGELFLGAF